MSKTQKALLPILLTLFAVSAHADTVRGRVVALDSAPIPGGEELSMSLGVGDIAVLSYPTDGVYLEGLEIEVLIPRAVRNAPGNFAVIVYNEVGQVPKKGVMTLSGSRILVQPVPAGNRVFLMLPTKAANDMHAGPGTAVAQSVTSASDFPVLVTIQPIAKGIPSSILDTPFNVKVRAVSIPKGGLHVVLTNNQTAKPVIWKDDGPVSVTLNGNPLPYQKGLYLLEPGLYRISVRSADFQDEYRTFNVNRGKTSEVSIVLKKPEAHARFDAPRGATVLLDGNEVNTAEQLVISPGKHTVLFRLGDYTVTKQFTALQKKDYEISLFLDIMINVTK